MRRYLFLCLLIVFALAACEGARNNSSWSTAEKGAEIKPSLKKKEAPAHEAEADTTAADSSKASH